MVFRQSKLAHFFSLTGIDLKVASKFFGQRFACGSSITGDDEIVIQGDFKDELFDIIPEKWPEVCPMICFYHLLWSF
jgi:density-regulated protein DRP1